MKLALALVAVAGCTEALDEPPIDGMFTHAEWAVIQGLVRQSGPPPDPTNRYADDPSAAQLGQRLFFETRFAGPLVVASELGEVGQPGRVACASCHEPGAWFRDPHPDRSLSFGTGQTRRNSPTLVDASENSWFGWGGAHDVEWKLVASVVESPGVFNGNRLQFAHLIYAHYRADYDALFPVPLDPALDPSAPDAARFPASGRPKAAGAPDGAWEQMTDTDRRIVNTILVNCAKAVTAYDRRLRSGDARFDLYLAGERDAMPPAAKRGLRLFIGKAECVTCHAGPSFTDHQFHVTALAQAKDPLDLGRFEDIPKLLNSEFTGAGAYSDDPNAGTARLLGIAATSDLRGRFRTTTLRHLSQTGPYMHDGSLATLTDVIRFYDAGGDSTGYPGVRDHALHPLHLTAEEVDDLVEFLQQLDGAPVAASLTTNTAAP